MISLRAQLGTEYLFACPCFKKRARKIFVEMNPKNESTMDEQRLRARLYSTSSAVSRPQIRTTLISRVKREREKDAQGPARRHDVAQSTLIPVPPQANNERPVTSTEKLCRMLKEAQSETGLAVDSVDNSESPFYYLREIVEGRNSRPFYYFSCDVFRTGIYDPYTLRHTTAPSGSTYVTLSAKGLTFSNNGQTEFTPLDHWIREYILFRRLHEIPFFTRFHRWKKLNQWQRSARLHNQKVAARSLNESLFVLDSSLKSSIMEIRRLTSFLEYDSNGDYSLFFRVTEGVNGLTLQVFKQKQANHLQRRQNRLESHMNDIIALVSAARRVIELRAIDPSNFDGTSDSANARYASRRKRCFSRLCEFMLSRCMVCFAMLNAGALAKALSLPAPLLCGQVNFSKGLVEFAPSKEALEESVSKVLEAMLGVVCDAEKLHAVESDEINSERKATLRELVEQQPEYVAIMSRIREQINLAYRGLRSHLSTFEPWKNIYSEKILKITAEWIRKTDPPAQWFRDAIENIRNWSEELEKVASWCNIGMFRVDNTSVVSVLRPALSEARKAVVMMLPILAREKNNALLVKMTNSLAQINQQPEKLEHLAAYLEYYGSLNVQEFDDDFSYIQEMYNNMEIDKEVAPSAEDLATIYSVTYPSMRSFRQRLADFTETRDRLVSHFGKEIVLTLDTLAHDSEKILSVLSAPSYRDPCSDIETCRQELRELFTKSQSIQREESRLVQYQHEFSMVETPVECVKDAFDLCSQLLQLWDGIGEWRIFEETVKERAVMSIDTQEFTDSIKMFTRVAQSCGSLSQNTALKNFRGKIEALRSYQVLVDALHNKNLQQHHWRKIDDLLRPLLGTSPVEQRSFSLDSLIRSDAFTITAELNAISLSASQEAELERELSSVVTLWVGSAKQKPLELVVSSYKDQRDTFVIGRNADEIRGMLKESRLIVSTILTSRFCDGVIRSRAQKVEASLSIVSKTLELWLEFQQTWIRLEGIFGLVEIARQWPADEALFRSADSWYREFLKPFSAGCTLYHVASSGKLVPLFQEFIGKLEKITSSLERKLDGKRQMFPRLYFLSDDDLLDLLSLVRTPERANIHINKIFDNVSHLSFTSFGEVAGVVGTSGEQLSLPRPIRARGIVERWLESFERSLMEYLSESLSSSDPPPQINLALQFAKWCAFVEDSMSVDCSLFEVIRSLERSLQSTAQQLRSTELRLQDRVFFAAEATQLVYCLATTRELSSEADLIPSCFLWQSKLRMTVENGSIQLHQGTCSVPYGFDYVGVSARLVITPITERIFFTIFSALKLFQGAAPSGPAGTGKTETVKDLSKQAARMCVVFNCGEGVTHRTMSKLLSGLSQSGGWICLDEFNRIGVDVLSVISSQLSEIRHALSKRVEKFEFQGNLIRLIPTLGVFVTMNPGYAGRTELPDNLKSLFRPIAVNMPSYKQIAEVVLFSQGFATAAFLSEKVTLVYKLANEQLSSQHHYDFGMRALKSVLLTAGERRRTFAADESAVLRDALIATNCPKLLHHDDELFSAIVDDVFPSTTLNANTMIEECQRHFPSTLHATNNQLTKAVEIITTIESRFGVVVMGQAGVGKTTLLDVACQTVSREGSQSAIFTVTRQFRINPKAVSYSGLFGQLNVSSQQWTDGVLSRLVKELLDTPTVGQNSWIIFDGPVDTLWVESLNSVLDESRLLCLDNGVRLKLNQSMRILFEVDNLDHASPATVSRCGIVFLDDSCLPHSSLVSPCLLTLFPTSDPGVPWGHNWAFDTIDKFFSFALAMKCVVQPTLRQLAQAIVSIMKFVSTTEHEHRSSPLHILAFALIWSVGCCANKEDAEDFDLLCREIFDVTPAGFPPSGTVFDYFLEGGRWISWPKTHDSPPLIDALGCAVYPTVDFHRVQMVSRWTSHVLLTGVSGSGKSKLLFLATHNASCKVMVRMSSFLSTETIAKGIESRLTQKSSPDQLTSFDGTPIVFVVDDLNLASLEVHGGCPPVELLRQVVSEGGFYDRSKLFFKQLSDTRTFAACGQQGSDKNSLSHRYTRHFNIFNMSMPPEDFAVSLYDKVFKTFFSTSLDDVKFPSDVRLIGDKLVHATVDVFSQCRQAFLPVPLRPQYRFNSRDIANVLQGILRGSPKVVTDSRAIVSLWVHECSRCLADRLSTDAERVVFDEIVSEVSRRFSFPIVLSGREGLWTDFMNPSQMYESVKDFNALLRFVESLPVEGTLTFRYCVQHVVRLGRILRTPFQNALLLGLSGVGKRTVVALASAALQYTHIFASSSCSSYELFSELLSRVLKGSAHGVTTVFYVNDSDVTDDRIMEDLCVLLNGGEIPAGFSDDEKEKICSEFAAEARSNGSGHSHDEVFSYFFGVARRHLRIVVSLSPTGQQFVQRCRRLPALTACCIVDWYDDWPEDALSCFTRREFAAVIDDPPAIETAVKVHRISVQHAARFTELTKRSCSITNSNFIDFVSLARNLSLHYEHLVLEKVNVLSTGSKKMIDARAQVHLMEVEVRRMEPLLEEKTVVANSVMEDVRRQTTDAMEIKFVVEKQKNVAHAEEREAEGIRADAERELSEALPEYHRALEALQSLSKSDIDEIKKYSVPTKAVSTTIDAVLTTIGERKAVGDWAAAKIVLSNPKFLERLANLKIDDVEESTIGRLQRFVNDPEFVPERVGSSGSEACRSLCLWTRAVESYFHVNQRMLPKRARLVVAEEQSEIAKRTLRESEHRLKEAEAQLRQSNATLLTVQRELKTLSEELARCKRRLAVAEALNESLAAEATRWESTVATLNQEEKTIGPKSLLAAAIVAYAGPFSPEWRETFIADLKKLPLLQVVARFELEDLVSKTEILDWNVCGLPKDKHSTENAVACQITFEHSKRWPLLIDPQGQGIRWMRQQSWFNSAATLDYRDPLFLSQIRRNIIVGVPTIVEHVRGVLHPSLTSLLLRDIRVVEGVKTVAIGSDTVTFSSMFRLVLVCTEANPLILPDTNSSAHVLNFCVTPAGLEEQALGDVVSIMYREVEEEKNKNLRTISELAHQLDSSQAKILKLLVESKGNILDNDALVAELQAAQATSNTIAASIESTEVQNSILAEKRNVFRPTASYIQRLYFVIAMLPSVNSLYQFPLDYVKGLAMRVILSRSADTVGEQRHSEWQDDICKALVREVHGTIRVGLLKSEHTLFDALVSMTVLELQGELEQRELSLYIAAEKGLRSPSGSWLSSEQRSDLAKLDGWWGTDLRQTLPDLSRLAICASATEFPLMGMSAIRRALVVRVCRPDLASEALEAVTRGVLPWNETTAMDHVNTLLEESSNATPILVMTQQGNDPSRWLADQAAERGAQVISVALGQGQGPIALEALHRNGGRNAWLLLLNCHIVPNFLIEMEDSLQKLAEKGELNSFFRMVLVAQSGPLFPSSVVQRSVKISFENPRGIAATVARLYQTVEFASKSRQTGDAPWPTILFSHIFKLCRLHAVTLERQRYGPVGWNVSYEFSDGDFLASLQWLQDEIHRLQPSMERYVIGTIFYGGRIVDAWDSRLFAVLFDTSFHDSPPISTLEGLRRELLALDDGTPSTVGLHDSASSRVTSAQSDSLLLQLVSVHANAQSHFTSSPSERATTLLAQVPPLLALDALHPSLVAKLCGRTHPLTSFLLHEVERYNQLIELMTSSLQNVVLSSSGQSSLTATGEDAISGVERNQIPLLWRPVAPITSKSLSSMIADTIASTDFFRTWIVANGHPSRFCLSRFFSPRSLITAIQQEFSRKSSTPIDCITTVFIVAPIATEAKLGVTFTDFFTDGFAWDAQLRRMTESNPLGRRIDAIQCIPADKSAVARTDVSMYTCPLYRTPFRRGVQSSLGTSDNMVLSLPVPAGGADPSHWILRGAALLLQPVDVE